MRTRSDVEGPSSGTVTADAVVARRELDFCEDDFWMTRDAEEFVVDTRPGIVRCFL